MLTSTSRKMMQRSFHKTVYRFTEAPVPELGESFGVYLHVPFCRTLCNFCPFYKERYTEELKEAYLAALLSEIESSPIRGRATWLYVGGGTPNVLTLEELGRILGALRRKVDLDQVGIELLPALLDGDYLRGLADLGVTKVSVGVESLSRRVMNGTGRRTAAGEHVAAMVALGNDLGLWTNTDLMVGLPHQDAGSFRDDVETVAEFLPDQVTVYPFMIIRGLEATPGMPEEEQFALIEEAYRMLAPHGYGRRSVWTFTRGDLVYDSSRDELVADYVGFGPAAFSTYGNWKVVNPDLASYLKSAASGQRMGFVAPKDPNTDVWRRFASMLYDLRCDLDPGVPAYIKAYVRLLRWSGYGGDAGLSEKGKHFAHALTKTVVEALPFPVQNPACVENYAEYRAYVGG